MRIRLPSTMHALRARALSWPLAWAVAGAVVLQVGLGGTLATRMAEQAVTSIGQATAHCTPDGSGHAAGHHGQPDGPPSGGHEHQTCLLCQGGLGPLLLLAALPSSPSSHVVGVARSAAWTDRLPAQIAVTANAPRAPPLNA